MLQFIIVLNQKDLGFWLMWMMLLPTCVFGDAHTHTLLLSRVKGYLLIKLYKRVNHVQKNTKNRIRLAKPNLELFLI